MIQEAEREQISLAYEQLEEEQKHLMKDTFQVNMNRCIQILGAMLSGKYIQRLDVAGLII